jgi:uncharacterized protein YcfL
MSSQLLVRDKKLQKQLTLGEVKTEFDRGILKVQARVKNKKKSTVAFEYQLKWFDTNGFEIDYPTQMWSPTQVGGLDEVYIQGIAPDEKAKRFQIHVRRPNPIK